VCGGRGGFLCWSSLILADQSISCVLNFLTGKIKMCICLKIPNMNGKIFPGDSCISISEAQTVHEVKLNEQFRVTVWEHLLGHVHRNTGYCIFRC
jgi:hypothetical protein